MTDVWPGQRVASPQAVQSAPRSTAPRAQRQPRQTFPGDPEQTITGLIPGVQITSRGRTPEHNRAVGGADNSYHLRNQAFDLVPPQGTSMSALESSIRGAGLPFAEVLNEGDHVHVAWDGVSPQAQQPTSEWPGQPATQQQLAAQDTVNRYEDRGQQDPISVASRALTMPWLSRQPRYVDTSDRSTVGPDGVMEIDLSTPSIVDRGDGQFEIFDAATSAYYPATAQEVDRARGRNSRDNNDRIARLEREQDPQYQAEYAAARGRSENVPAFLENLLQGASLGGVPLLEGALGYIDPNVEGIDRGLASQAARDASRDRQSQLVRDDPVGTIGTQLLGGLATPGLNATGGYISGATGAARGIRAAQVGAGYGAAAGLIGSTGGLDERLDDAALGGLTGAGVGAVGQRFVDRLTPAAQQARGGAARRLSRLGVDLTPGQMIAETPVIGPAVRYAEDIAGGFNPLMTGVRQRQNEDVVRAAGNEALSALDAVGPQVRLPRGARTGYEVSQTLRRVLGDRYDDVTSRITAQADDQLATDLADFVTRQSENLDDASLSRLQRVLDQNVLSRFESDGSLSGPQFKNIETVLRQQSERASRPSSTLADQDLSEAFDGARDIMRNVIARQFPDEAAEIAALNRAYAISKRVERAVSGSPGFAREGTPTPGELSQTVRQMSSDGQIAGQRGLLQGLAADARTVLPATVGDTGSGQRAVLGGVVGGVGTGAIAAVNPALAAGIAAGAVVYSRPGIAALNAIYRATDSQTAQELVQGLARVAQRDPALLPYYEAAAQHLLSLATPRQPTSQPAPQSQPLAMPGQ